LQENRHLVAGCFNRSPQLDAEMEYASSFDLAYTEQPKLVVVHTATSGCHDYINQLQSSDAYVHRNLKRMLTTTWKDYLVIIMVCARDIHPLLPARPACTACLYSSRAVVLAKH